MTLQNRVDPWGKLHAHPSKSATRMGNRGILHNQDKQIIKQSDRDAWISCLMAFKENKRSVFTTNKYSELFFLDEATAFSAGHRPCGGCQNARYKQFKQVWMEINHAGVHLSVDDWDKKLDQDRLTTDKQKRTFQAQLSDLPVGTFFEYDAQAIAVVAKNRYRLWSFEGYQTEIHLEPDLMVTVLTPQSFVAAFKAGFVPYFHDSVD